MDKETPPASHGIAKPHSLVAKIFHWGFLAVFVFALTKQLDEVEELEDVSLLQYELIFASAFLGLLMIRFLYMQFTRPSALPNETPVRTKRLARAVHLAMYISTAAIAVTGIWVGVLYWNGTKSGAAMDAALIFHEISVLVTYWLIAGHVAAAVYHRRQTDGVWDAMVPFWREKRSQSSPPDA